MSSPQSSWHDARVVRVRPAAERTQEITLQFPTEYVVRPGDHIKVSIPAPVDDVRSYSAVRGAGNQVTISVLQTTNSRGGSLFMHGLHEGDTVRATGPSNNFPLRIGASHYVLVAGCIGITAIRGMAEVLHRLGASYELHFAARSPEAAAFREELESTHGENIHFYWASEGDFLDVDALISAVKPGTELYMCGPIRLMEEIRRCWNQHGCEPTALRFETFGNSGWFKAEPFEVRIPQYDVSVMVGLDQSLLDAVQAAGVRIVNDCRRGECGLCQVKVLDSSAAIDHRDVFFSEKQKSDNHKMCSCVSRVAALEPNNTHTTPTLTIEIP